MQIVRKDKLWSLKPYNYMHGASPSLAKTNPFAKEVFPTEDARAGRGGAASSPPEARITRAQIIPH